MAVPHGCTEGEAGHRKIWTAIIKLTSDEAHSFADDEK
jgi:hypothetical protein